MSTLSKYGVNSVAGIMSGLEDIDPGSLVLVNLTLHDAEGNLAGDITWNEDKDQFEWVQA